MQGKIYQFEDYLLDVSEQRLQKNGVSISLPPKVFEVLTALLKRPGQLVTYQELMEEVWPGTFVEETNLRYSVHTLRKTLPEHFIETVPKRGYRFKPPVKSFTTEEFIKLHTGNFKKDELLGAVAKPTRPNRLGKYAVMAIMAGLMAGIGWAAYYFWQNGRRSAENSKYSKTIAVLPFSVIGENPEKSVEIQKGLADVLVFNLSKIRGLKVTPAKEVQSYFGKEFEPAQVGQRLSADEVLTGTYRPENNLVRINVSLLRVADGEPVWTETFTVKENTQIELENAIALPIAWQIELKVASLRDEKTARNFQISEESLKDYLAARQIFRTYERNRRQEMLNLFEKIIVNEPEWALGHSGYAAALVLTHGGVEGCQNAPHEARKALEIDDSVAEAHLVLGLCHQFTYDWKNAEQAYQKALQINPEYAEAYHEYANLLDLQRRFAEAENHFKKAIELEPFSPLFRSSFCGHYYYDKKFNEALAQCFEVRKIDPEFWLVPKKLHWIYVAQGKFDEVFKLHYGNLTEADRAKNQFAKALAEDNIKKYWEISIDTRLKDTRKRYSPFAIASFYAQLGDAEKTADYLEQELETDTCKCNLPLANPDPLFDAVRQEERFVELMKKINLNP